MTEEMEYYDEFCINGLCHLFYEIIANVKVPTQLVRRSKYIFEVNADLN